MPIIRVDMFAGRTEAQKRQLVSALTQVFVETCGGKPEAVQILIHDYTPENWAVSGKLVSDRTS